MSVVVAILVLAGLVLLTLRLYSVVHRAKAKFINWGTDAFANRVDKSRPRQRH